MKTTVAPYETAVKCLRIECTNGLTVRLTRYPVDLTMSTGQVYQAGTGYDFTSYSATASLTPAAIDLNGFLGFAGVTRDAIQSGVFDGARCYLFACDFLNPVEDYEPIVASIMGKTTFTDNRYHVEEMSLVDALNQSVGKSYTAQCPKVFGGQEYAGCKKVLGPLTVTGTLTAVTSSAIISDAARLEAVDYFAAGTMRFTSGLNAGLKPMEIKRHEADGTLETFEPFYYAPAIGDAYELIPGCRKRLVDCRDKWNNILNFGGFSHIPTASQYGDVGGSSAGVLGGGGNGGLSQAQQGGLFGYGTLLW